eukprot:80281-Alexandrium_andersonii.AAC.1
MPHRAPERHHPSPTTQSTTLVGSTRAHRSQPSHKGSATVRAQLNNRPSPGKHQGARHNV